MTNLLTRNSPRELTTPFPSKDEMHEIYEAALRAPDHAWLRPSRFIEVTGTGPKSRILNDDIKIFVKNIYLLLINYGWWKLLHSEY